MRFFDIVVIGGGASGLMCLNFLDKHKHKIAVIDKTQLGKKILVTGNGRCNLTNKNILIDKYNTPETKNVLENFDNVETLKFFKKIGIECFFDEEGRCYPYSETASDVRNALTRNIDGIECINGSVEKIEKSQRFKITLEEGDIIEASKVVIACGNKDIGKILNPLNLKLEKKKNVLTGFVVNENFDKNLLGVRENVIVKAKVNGKEFCEKGQIQFKKDGISGIVIFNLSAFVAKNGECPFEVMLQFLPDLKIEQLRTILKYRRQFSNLLIKDALIGLIKPNLAKYILNVSKIRNLESDIKYLKDLEIESIVKNLKDLRFVCEETYDDAQILSGGIDLKNLNNLQSKQVDGLYFCGEATNVFGFCGGNNLQWAWSSGYFVAKELNKNI